MNEKSVPEQAQAVVASTNMVPPNLRKALEKRDYTTRPDAPATHARLWGDPDGNAYHLMFNGADLVTLRYPDGVRPGLRLHSDGDFQSVPFVQQFLAWADQDAPMEVEFTSPVEMWNMRPQRAQGGHLPPAYVPSGQRSPRRARNAHRHPQRRAHACFSTFTPRRVQGTRPASRSVIW